MRCNVSRLLVSRPEKHEGPQLSLRALKERDSSGVVHPMCTFLPCPDFHIRKVPHRVFRFNRENGRFTKK